MTVFGNLHPRWIRRGLIAAFWLGLVAPLNAAESSPPAVTGELDFSQRQTGDFMQGLPADTRRISAFGERPVFSPDGRRIAFIGKSYGDAFEYDIAAGTVTNLTEHLKHAGFLRVHYLPDGNLLLLGPRQMDADRMAMRIGKIELWYLARSPNAVLQPLNEIVSEGIAVSRIANRIAWAVLEPKHSEPGDTTPEYTALETAEISVQDGVPSLSNRREIVRKPSAECVLEAQDFRDQDREVTASCYDLGGVRLSLGKFTQILGSVILGVRVDSGAITVHRDGKDGSFTEIEGIAPSGDWTLVECGPGYGKGLDLCRLDLVQPGRPLVRLTHVLDYGAHRASNPVVSPDGQWITFQIGRAQDEAGVGQGILLMPMPAAGR